MNNVMIQYLCLKKQFMEVTPPKNQKQKKQHTENLNQESNHNAGKKKMFKKKKKTQSSNYPYMIFVSFSGRKKELRIDPKF